MLLISWRYLDGIPLIFIDIKYECPKSNILHLENESFSQQCFPQMTIQSKIQGWQIYLADELPTSK